MNKEFNIIKTVLCIAILFGASFSAQSGKTAPSFSARDIKGKIVKSETIYASAPTIVFFWHTCGCCGITKDLNDAFNKSYTAYKDKGINIVGIALDGKKATAQVKKAVKVNKMLYTSIVDNNNKVKNIFKPTSLPATYIIAKGGKILSIFNGYKPGDNDKIAKILGLVFKNL